MSDSSGLIARLSPLCGPEDTVEVCPALAEQRRVLVETIGSGDLSRPALVEAMVRGGPEVWETDTSFCEAVMLAKEEPGCLREHLAVDLRLRRHPRRRPVRPTSHDDLWPP